MNRFMGVIYAAVAALVIAMAPMPSATAAPVLAGTGNVILSGVPQTTDNVRWRGGRGFRGGGFRGHRGFRHRGYRRGYYRPYRPAYHRPAYYGGPVYYGARCWIRPARWVYTPYGPQLRPARRVCR